ncbi:AbiH family protein [Enorma shizhengliae]|uniref:SIR2-like domain-containing protein n=1 Tax=Enorma shizhengliae TaxID=2606615 RepID=A0A7K0G9G2_9ACTN|nr:AbiH family protein [Enorma shizhengliae]MRX79819.1 hypothetical protein [Enorma shizhengliae]
MADNKPASLLTGIDVNNVVDSLRASVTPETEIPDYSSYLPDMRSTWHQLVIIGNGFDLACGLKSDFKSFFEPRLERLQAIEREGFSGGKSAGSRLREAGLTAWDIILTDRSGDNWYDVEGAIARWVRPQNPPRHLDLLDSVFSLEFGDKKSPFGLLAKYPAERRVRRYLVERGFGLGDEYSRENLDKLMLDELHRLEDEFDAYLTKQVEQTPQYPKTARQLLWEIIKRGVPNADDFRPDLSVLSFNYTGPKEMKYNNNRAVSYVNIHGKLGDGIVFGIDGRGMMTNRSVAPFTKTYRLMAMGGPQHYEVLPGDVDLIKFFGHSLASADYSYFQAIFDSIDLYDGDACLAFYYRPYAEKSDLEVRTDMMNRVTELLSTYGQTLDNADHGNNLIHKLLLEGRLSIERI